MPISWNEIRHNAHAFAKEWADESSEDAEAKSFWDAFFAVFGVKRRTVASFEEPVKKLSGNWGYIDLFWPGKMLVEHKSLNKSLDKANSQAMEYIHGLKNEGRDEEIPRYIVLSDFARIALYDLEDEQEPIKFPLKDLYKHVHAFAFIPGYQQHKLDAEDPVNIQAVELLGHLHDALEEGGYTGHDLERFLVRILFCLFAEDTGIFEQPNAFALYIENHTRPDGTDLGVHLDQFFQVLDTDKPKRQKNLIEELAELPYVNGDLFKERLGFANLDRKMRDELVRCTRFDWSRISPAVFGSLFQSVMEPKERRQVGAHYTSERDIMKLVRSLFLDDLRAEFEKLKGSKAKLNEFHKKLGNMRFLDPACGCGNFLVVTYRELRLLEMEVLKAIHGDQMVMSIETFARVDVDAMYGIEINEFPARIAEVAMWLIDHQMNQKLSEVFGLSFVRLPLKKSAKIVNANALRIDWNEVLPREKCSYVLGNPPFIGHHLQTAEQKADQHLVLMNIQARGVLDYVCNWYVRAANYIKGTNISVGFVSTNSVTQGEQVGILWTELFSRYQVKILFAHRTFAWESEARGAAHVHVVIIGFGNIDRSTKQILDYESDPSKPTSNTVKNISPYLVEGADMALVNRSTPLSSVPKMIWGNKPTDGGFLILSPDERRALLSAEPGAAPWIRRYTGATEFLNHEKRYCLWLVEMTPNELRRLPEIRKRVDAVRDFRLASSAATTRAYAASPTIFRQIAQPKTEYLIIPLHTSETRRYIPIAFMPASVIASNACSIVPDAGVFHFAMLSSAMHMAWVRQVCGRIKSDFRYSSTLVYNNYPWPQSPTEKQTATVEAKAQAVLDARKAFPDSSLADLYDPVCMPPRLTKAHTALDRAVDACYRDKPFHSDRERVEFLFELYEKLTAPLTAGLDKKPKRKRKGDAE